MVVIMPSIKYKIEPNSEDATELREIVTKGTSLARMILYEYTFGLQRAKRNVFDRSGNSKDVSLFTYDRANSENFVLQKRT